MAIDYRLSNIEDIKRYILSGNATFSVKNTQTGKEMFFQVCQPSIDSPYFVRAKNDAGEYVYVGTIFQDGQFKVTDKSAFHADSPTSKTAIWIFPEIINLKPLPQNVVFYKSNCCCICGNQMKAKKDLETGYESNCHIRLDERMKVMNFIKNSFFGIGTIYSLPTKNTNNG